MFKLFVVIGCMALASPAFSAALRQIRGNDGIDVIAISGVIADGDEIEFRKLAAVTEKAMVVLDSQGGSVLPALEIGRAIRLKGFATAVAAGDLCASACALTWLAGSPRFYSAQSQIGFHASYRVVGGNAQESGVGNALIGAYLNQIGLPQSAVIYVTSAPPEGMEWLTAEKASTAGIEGKPLDVAPIIPSTDPIGSPEPYDPMNTVSRFYSALAIGDGDTAAALVVPEKRGRGPFNEGSIHAFFGSMKIPLTLRSTLLKSKNLVVVAYDYVSAAGSPCNGKANVSTTYIYGKTLITGIKALNGC